MLCVAQAIMGIPSDRRFLAVARKRLCHLFPELPAQPGFHKRRRRLSDTIEWLIGIFASESPGAEDSVVLLDSTPVECGRSRETARRSALGDAPPTATVARTRASSGTCACTWPARPTGHRERPPWPAPTAPSARSGSLCSSERSEVGRPWSATRATPGASSPSRSRRWTQRSPPRRARGRAAPVVHPPADRVGLLDLQGRAHPRAPRRAHAREPARAGRDKAALPGRLHLAQPPARSPEPLPCRLRGVRAWNQRSRRSAGRSPPYALDPPPDRRAGALREQALELLEGSSSVVEVIHLASRPGAASDIAA